MKPHQDSFPMLSRVLLISILLLISLHQTSMAQDSLGVRRISTYHCMSVCTKLAIVNNYAYVITGNNELSVIDVTDSISPQLVGYAYINRYVRNIAAWGSYVYLASDSGLIIVDVVNNTNPHVVGSSYNGRYYLSVAVEGNYAYMLGYSYLDIYNISDVSHPNLISSFHTPANDIAKSGNYVYIASSSQLQVIDVSNPFNPIQVGAITRPPNDQVFTAAGDFVYASHGSGLSVINVTNPLNPTVVGDYSSSVTLLTDISVFGNHVYFTGYNYSGYDCRIVNVQNPSAPLLVGQYDFGNDVGYGVTSQNNRIYVSSFSGLNILNVTNPSNPLLIGNCRSVNAALIGDISGSTLCIANGSGFSLIDVVNTSSPRLLSSYSCQAGSYVTVNGNYALVNSSFFYGSPGSGYHFQYSLNLINITNPRSPFFVWGYVNTDVFPKDCFLLDGDFAYITEGDHLRILDLSIIDSIHVEGSLWLPHRANGLAIANNSLFIANDSYGLTVVDVTSPSDPILLGRCFSSGIANDVAIHGNYAYLAAQTAGVRVIDIQNLTAPIEIGFFDTQGSALGIAIQGDHAIVADGSNGLRIIDISDPTSLSEVGFYNTSGSAKDLVITNNTAFVADSSNIQIFDFSESLPVIQTRLSSIPSEFVLNPNFPNPFNSKTEIRYAIAKTGKVDLRVFDVTGREVAKLIDFHQNPGEYTFHFDGKNLATGTYFVRLQAGEFVKTQKMVLLR